MSGAHARRFGALALAAFAANAAAVAPGPEQDWILHCQGCHGSDGRGASHRVPSLRDSVAPLMQIAEGRDFLMRVPGAANSSLSDEALAGVLNWLVGEFGGGGVPADAHRFTREEVAAARRHPMMAVRRSREDVAARLVAAGFARPEDY